MIMILRIAAVFFLFWFGWRLLKKWVRRQMQLIFGDEVGSGAANNQVADMVQDPTCGAWISKVEATTEADSGKVHHFCSDACRQKWRADKGLNS